MNDLEQTLEGHNVYNTPLANIIGAKAALDTIAETPDLQDNPHVQKALALVKAAAIQQQQAPSSRSESHRSESPAWQQDPVGGFILRGPSTDC